MKHSRRQAILGLYLKAVRRYGSIVIFFKRGTNVGKGVFLEKVHSRVGTLRAAESNKGTVGEEPVPAMREKGYLDNVHDGDYILIAQNVVCSVDQSIAQRS